jgi:polyphosphate kinase
MTLSRAVPSPADDPVPHDGAVHETFDVEPPYVPETEALAHLAKYEDRFLDRELSWLRFNLRLLEMAEDVSLPLLERVRSIAFFASNLDEFFMVRVAGLKRRIAAGMAVRAASGMMPRDVLEAIWTRAAEQSLRHAEFFRDDIVPSLSANGIDLVRWDDLDREEQKFAKRFFKDRVFPVLTPLAVDPAHPFPYISGLSLNMAVLVRNPKTGKEHFARVKVPPTFSRFVALGNQRFVPLEDVIGEHLKRLFPGMDVLQFHTFRVTRNEDLEVEEDDAENLLAALEKELLRRRFGPPVRLEVEESITPQVLELLTSELDISPQEVVRVPGPLDLRGLHDIADLPREDLKYPAFVPMTHGILSDVESTCSVPRGVTTSCSTTRTTRSRRRCSGSSSRPPRIRTCWRSSRRCTERRATRRSSTPWSTRPSPASRCSPSSRSRPASTSRPTSGGPASSSTPGATWSTARSA